MFGEEIEKARNLNVKLSFGIGIFQGLSNMFINGVVLGVIYAGGQMLINNEINAGQMMAYLAATQMIQRSFTQLSILFGQALRGLSSGARVFEVEFLHLILFIRNLFQISEFKYLKLKSSIPVNDEGLKLDYLNGHIEFNDVSFSYPNRNETVKVSPNNV